MNLAQTGKRVFGRILLVIFKHGWVTLAAFSFVGVSAAIGLFIVTPTYEAMTRIAITVEGGLDRTVQQNADFSQEGPIRAEMELLVGDSIAQEVISEIGLRQIYPEIYERYMNNKDSPSTDAAVIMFRKSLKVRISGEPNNITVRFRHANPEVAAHVVNRLVERFKQRYVPVIYKTGTPESTSTQTSQRASFTLAPKKVGQVSTGNENTDFLLAQKHVYANKISKAESEVARINAETDNRRAMAQDVTSRLLASERIAGEDKPLTPTGESMSELRLRLVDLSKREQALLKTYNETSGSVTLVREEIRKIEQILAKKESSEYWKILAGIEQDLNTLRSQALAQKTDISQSRLKLIKIERALEEAAALEAERETAKTREEAGNKETHAQGIHVTVIEEAVPPTRPIRPIIPLNIAFAVVFGLGASIGSAFIAERCSRTFARPRDIEECLGIKVLATVDQRPHKKRKRGYE